MLDVEKVTKFPILPGEVVPVCKKHGVEKYKRAEKRRHKGWEWYCLRCKVEREHRRRIQLVPIGEFFITARKATAWYTFYRLRPEDVLEMYDKQDRKCLFGGEPLAWEDIYIDHEHGYPGVRHSKYGVCRGCPKGSIRGLVCDRHNRFQGSYEADPEGYLAVARWHIEHNGGKWNELCGGEDEEVVNAY